MCIVADPLYSSGASQLDVLVPPGDDNVVGPVPIDLDCFPYAAKRHSSFYVSDNTVSSVKFGFLFSLMCAGVYQWPHIV